MGQNAVARGLPPDEKLADIMSPATTIIAKGSLNWEVVAELGSTRPRRVLSVLLYAESEDLFVPAWVIERLYHASRGDDAHLG